MAKYDEKKQLKCSFCGKAQENVKKIQEKNIIIK